MLEQEAEAAIGHTLRIRYAYAMLEQEAEAAIGRSFILYY